MWTRITLQRFVYMKDLDIKFSEMMETDMDEEGKFPKKLKKGVLSEDGIYNMLERNREIMDILNGFDC